LQPPETRKEHFVYKEMSQKQNPVVLFTAVTFIFYILI
jgi:hypothetical protein